MHEAQRECSLCLTSLPVLVQSIVSVAGGTDALPGTAEAASKSHPEPSSVASQGWAERTLRRAKASDASLDAEKSSDSSEFGGHTTFTEEDLKGDG